MTPDITVVTRLANGSVFNGQSTCIDTSSGYADSVQISCQLDNEKAARPYTISWSRNGHDLGFNDHIFTTTDNGIYTCKVENNCGNVTATTTVTSKFCSVSLT